MSDVVKSEDDVLNELIAKNSKLQAQEGESSLAVDTLLLAKQGTKALSKLNKDLYIEGLRQGDIFLQKQKVVLGETVDVVPLAFITLYQERESAAQDARFFGYWNKGQASAFDLVEDSFYNRQLPNGHILLPVNWVMVEVIGHPELEKAVIPFKSTGSKIWKKWKEDARERSESSATLVYTIFEEAYDNKSFQWTDFGFSYKENLVEKDKEMAIHCLKKSNAIREAYTKSTLVANRAIKASGVQPKAIADASETEDSYDDAIF